MPVRKKGSHYVASDPVAGMDLSETGFLRLALVDRKATARMKTAPRGGVDRARHVAFRHVAFP